MMPYLRMTMEISSDPMTDKVWTHAESIWISYIAVIQKQR